MGIARAGIVVAVFLLLGVRGTAQGRLLGSDQTTGEFPFAFASGDFLPRPKTMRVEFFASPQAPIEGDYRMSCFRGSHHRAVETSVSDSDGILVTSVPLTMGRPDSCYASASSKYVSFDQSGTLSIDIYGKSKPKRKRKR